MVPTTPRTEEYNMSPRSQFIQKLRALPASTLQQYKEVRNSFREVNLFLMSIDRGYVQWSWLNALWNGAKRLGLLAIFGVAFQSIFNNFVDTGKVNTHTVILACTAIVVSGIITAIFTHLSTTRSRRFDSMVDYVLDEREITHQLTLDLGTLLSPEFQQLRSNMQRGKSAVQNIWRKEQQAISDTIGFVMAMGVTATLDIHLALLALVPLIPRTYRNKVIRAKERELWKAQRLPRRRLAEIESYFTGPQNLAQMKTFKFVPFLWGRYTTLREKIRDDNLKRQQFESHSNMWMSMLDTLVLILMIAYLGQQLVAGELTFTKVMLFYGSLQSIDRAMYSLTSLPIEISNATQDYAYLTEFYAKQPAIDETKAHPITLAAPPLIEIEGLVFTYPSQRTAALVGCDLIIKPGDKLALVGKNGSGKTTLADMTVKIRLPDQGSVRVNSVNLNEITQDSWLEHVLYVRQRPNVPDLEIDEALTGTERAQIDKARLERAAELTGSREFIELLAHGFQTQIGEEWPGGVEFSAGQKQKLFLTAALYRLLSPQVHVAIFDEPMANCDMQTRHLFYSAITRIENKSVIVIAHDPNYLHYFPTVVELDYGKVIRVMENRDEIEEYRGALALSLGADM
jgi:ABC-type bacteriocin/lantibiotic exporter with double-glycine peptidase domain